MKFEQIIKDYLTFNKKEQRGLFALIVILVLSIIARVVVPYALSQEPADFSGFAAEIKAFERDMQRIDSLDSLERNGRLHKYIHPFVPGKPDSLKGGVYSKQIVPMIELNSADTFDLQRLKGIGPSFANRIVSYRIRLGGYLETKQLLEVFGMDSAKYNGIIRFLTVNPDSVRKININRVTFKELLFHPYFPFEVTKAIMIYRKDHKKFRSIEELKQVRIINDSIYRKIYPYLMVQD